MNETLKQQENVLVSYQDLTDIYVKAVPLEIMNEIVEHSIRTVNDLDVNRFKQ